MKTHSHLALSISLGLFFAGARPAFAQGLAEQILPGNLQPIKWISGEARLNRDATDPAERLACGPKTKGEGYYYQGHSNEDIVLIFSCGQRLRGAGFGSWTIRRARRDGAWYHSIASGTFSRGVINTGRLLTPFRPFELRGKTTFLDGACTDDASSMNVRIFAGYGSSPGRAVVEITDDGGRLILKGSFGQNVRISAGLGAVGDVNQRLHLDKKAK